MSKTIRIAILALATAAIALPTFAEEPEYGPNVGEEMELAQKTLSEFTRSATEGGARYTTEAQSLNLKCEGNQHVKLRLGATANVTAVRIDGKAQTFTPGKNITIDITKAVIDPNRFPPMVADFKLEIEVKGAKAPAAPEGPVEVAVTFKMGGED